MDERVYTTPIQLPSSTATTPAPERTYNDPDSKTIEFLRARLLSERSVSKAAREQAQQLTNKIAELEQRLESEVQLRKQLEKARLEILSKYKDDLGGHLCLEGLEVLGVNDSISEQGSKDISSREKENFIEGNSKASESDGPNNCNQQPAREKSLAWFPKRDSRVPRQTKSFSNNLFLISNDMDSPRRNWNGKSVRKIRNKEDRDQDPRAGDGDDMNRNGQSDIHRGETSDMEKILEHQSELIEQFEAEENAQRAWEEKFQEEKISNKSGKIEQNKTAIIQRAEKISVEDKILSVVDGGKLEIESTVIGLVSSKNENYKNPHHEFALDKDIMVLNEVDDGDKSANDEVSKTDSKAVTQNSGATTQSEIMSSGYTSKEHTEAITAGNQKTESLNVHSQKEGQLDKNDNISTSISMHISEFPAPSRQGLNIPHNEKHIISFMPTDRREAPFHNDNTMWQKVTTCDENAYKSGTAEKNVYSFRQNMYGCNYSETPIITSSEDMLKGARHLESQYLHFDKSFQQQAPNLNVRNASRHLTDPWGQVPYQQIGRQTTVDKVMDVLRALQMAKQEIVSSEDQYVYDSHLNFDSSQNLRMMDPLVHGTAGKGAAALNMPPMYLGRESRHYMNMPHVWGKVGTKPGQTDPMFPPYTVNRR